MYEVVLIRIVVYWHMLDPIIFIYWWSASKLHSSFRMPVIRRCLYTTNTIPTNTDQWKNLCVIGFACIGMYAHVLFCIVVYWHVLIHMFCIYIECIYYCIYWWSPLIHMVCIYYTCIYTPVYDNLNEYIPILSIGA